MSFSREEPGEGVDDLARAVIEAAIEVHRALGPGYFESVYEEALAIELTEREVPFSRQAPIGIEFKTHSVGLARLDFLVGGLLVVELKTVEQLAPVHIAQVLSYLKATRLRLGLLLNFNRPLLRDGGIRRVVLSQ